jgi:hypothetical protein
MKEVPSLSELSLKLQLRFPTDALPSALLPFLDEKH